MLLPWIFCILSLAFLWNHLKWKKLPSNCYSVTLYSEKRGSQLNKNNSQNYRIHKKHSTAAPPEKSYGVESFQLSFLMAGFLFRFVIFNLQQALRFDEKLCEISCKTKDRFFPFKKRIFPVKLHFRANFHSYHKKILYSIESGKIEYSWVTLFN